MFKITPINDKEMQKAQCELCGASFKPDLFAYQMLDVETGELMAVAQFEIDGEYGYIADLKPRIGYSDFEAMFILGRATMNFIDLCGTHRCRAAVDAADERLIKSIGFKQNGGIYECDMTGMFDGNCGGHTVKEA